MVYFCERKEINIDVDWCFLFSLHLCDFPLDLKFGKLETTGSVFFRRVANVLERIVKTFITNEAVQSPLQNR